MSISVEKLLAFGFKKQGDVYVFSTYLLQEQLKLTVISDGKDITKTSIVDTAFGEEYTLHLVEGAEGSFVGQVREEYKKILSEIKEKCSEITYHKYPQTKEIVRGVNEKYGVLPEYPFEDDNETAVFRRKDNKKWFFIKMSIKPQKLNFPGENLIDVINVKIDPEELNLIADNERYFRAYHMNKKMWATIVLDGRLPTEEILKRIDDSYNLVQTKRKGR